MTSSIRQQLNVLSEVGPPFTQAQEHVIAKGLESTRAAVVRDAASLAGSIDRDLNAEMLEAFSRFLVKPEKTDCGCEAKTALVDALRKSRFDDEAFYLDAVVYRQPEPVWGGEVDTAAELRALAGFALVEQGSRHALEVAVNLLMDSENAARAGGARALAGLGSDAARHLLRLKLHFGDAEPQVLGECCSALLSMAKHEAIPVVADLLTHPTLDVRMEAALALGSSRLPDALPPLRKYAERRTDDSEELEIAFTAIAVLQHGPAIEWLFDCVNSSEFNRCLAAITALGHARDRPAIRARLKESVDRMQSRTVSQLFTEVFDTR